MPQYERPEAEPVEPIQFKIGGSILTAPGEPPFGTLAMVSPAAGDGPLSVKATIIPQLLQLAFGDQLTEASGLTDNDGMWLFQRLIEAWFGTPTSPSSPSFGGGGNTGSGWTQPLSQEGSVQPTVSTIGSGSPLPSQQ